MKKFIICLCLFALCASAALAQESLRTWNMGPLTWNDFTPAGSEQSANPDEHSFLEFVFDITTTARTQNGIVSGEPEAVAYTVRSKSWVDSTHRTAAELRYNQVLFDIVELYRRQLQQMINAMGDELNEELLLDSIMQQAIDKTDQYCDETRFGQDSMAVCIWQRRTAALLNRSDSVSKHDSVMVRTFYTYSDDPLRLGAGLLGGFHGTIGDLHDHFGHGGGMGLDFELGMYRHFLVFALNIGANKCRKDAYNVNDPIDNLYTDDFLTILNAYLGYGFSVIDRTRLRITPFVGWGLLGYYYSEEDEYGDESYSYGSSNGCLHFGINTQYHFQNTIFNGSHDRYSVSLKLFGTYNRFRTIQGTPEGFTFNAQLGISFLTGSTTKRIVANQQ